LLSFIPSLTQNYYDLSTVFGIIEGTKVGVANATMTTFVNNDVSPGDIVQASDHNTQGANLASVINGNLDNDNIKSGSGISGSKLANDGISAEKLASDAGGNAWEEWTPTFANFTKGSATVVGKYKKIDKTVFYKLSIILSGSTMGTGPTFTLPFTAVSHSTGFPLGQGVILDSGTATYEAQVRFATTTTALIQSYNSSGNGAGISSTAPFTWANNDEIQITGFYESA
jgi:hypothetical protein